MNGVCRLPKKKMAGRRKPSGLESSNQFYFIIEAGM
jgi:hypothetical protein